MARMNISIPDALYKRVDRARDRINASKVCATALEKELDMIEGQTVVADPDVARLVERLQGAKSKWYQRGREDGRRWAIETATREELWQAGSLMADVPAEHLAMLAFGRQRSLGVKIASQLNLAALPSSFDAGATLRTWLERDGVGTPASSEGAAAGVGDEGAHNTPVAHAREVDEIGYVEGWQDAVKEIWKAVSAALR